MKNLLFLLITMVMLFACNNAEKKTEGKADQKCEQSEEKKCENSEKKCCEMTEEQKAEMEAWKDWNNQTDEKKEQLVASRKACFDKKMAECKEKCEGKKEECPEKAAKCAEMKEKLENWDNLTIDEKKAFLDEVSAKCCKEKKCCKDKKKECEAGKTE